jgi:hypothetical protein
MIATQISVNASYQILCTLILSIVRGKGKAQPQNIDKEVSTNSNHTAAKMGRINTLLDYEADKLEEMDVNKLEVEKTCLRQRRDDSYRDGCQRECLNSTMTW